jgi:hypothetical protein
MITDPQYKFICDLVSKKDISSLAPNEIAYLTSGNENFRKMNKKQASNAIAKLKDLPAKPVAVVEPKPIVEISDSEKFRFAQMMLEATGSSKVGKPLPEFVQVIAIEPAPQPVIAPEPEHIPADKPVPDAGYYFVVDPTSNPAGKESFFRVSKPTDGRWEGYTFLSIQASDDFYPIKDKQRREIIFSEILKDPINAMNEYGIRLGRCGVATER